MFHTHTHGGGVSPYKNEQNPPPSAQRTGLPPSMPTYSKYMLSIWNCFIVSNNPIKVS